MTEKNSGRFKPGQSGNPSGRPKIIVEVAKAAREYTAEAIDTLAKVMRDPKATPAARVSAAVAMLERGFGKAPQSMTIRREGDYSNLSDAELIAIASGESGEASAEEPDKLN